MPTFMHGYKLDWGPVSGVAKKQVLDRIYKIIKTSNSWTKKFLLGACWLFSCITTITPSLVFDILAKAGEGVAFLILWPWLRRVSLAKDAVEQNTENIAHNTRGIFDHNGQIQSIESQLRAKQMDEASKGANDLLDMEENSRNTQNTISMPTEATGLLTSQTNS